MLGALLFSLVLFRQPALHYAGGLLGVQADVNLSRDPPRADITLRGIPVGGTLTGGASYDGDYAVQLDADLQRRLRRLRVAVLSVTPSSTWDRVFVAVQLPLFLGRHNITLWRT
jgi:hypothetical protein